MNREAWRVQPTGRGGAADQSPDFSRLIRLGAPSPFDQTAQ
jgi:hypothetical protein